MPDPDELRSVGRVGELSLDYERRGRETILAHSRCSSPWHLSPSITLDDTGCAYQPLLNPSGGLVGGDRLSVLATLGPGTHVLISTPSANRVYRSLSEPCIQTVELHLEAGATLEWVPLVTIPYTGSRFQQRISVRLAAGATCLLWDAMASGRVARCERWVFDSYDNEIRIGTASGHRVIERMRVARADLPAGIRLIEEWDYVASLFLIGDAVSPESVKELEERIRVCLDEQPGRILGGVSEPAALGLVVKLVARTAPDLKTVLEGLWGVIRSVLWGLPLPALRQY
jgi:urease accessory protein